MSRRLTLNLGLRYDPLVSLAGDQASHRTVQCQQLQRECSLQVYTNAPAGLLFPGDKGVPEWGAKGSYNNFSPRAGFAYDVTGDGKTSVRGGAGIFFDAIQDGIFNNRFVDVTPFSPQFSLTQPQGTFSNPLSWLGQSLSISIPSAEGLSLPRAGAGHHLRSCQRGTVN